jgi:hypothetical protein
VCQYSKKGGPSPRMRTRRRPEVSHGHRCVPCETQPLSVR